jgi:hypothetical protein
VIAYTREMTRVWAFALVLVITGAPLAPALCGITCADHGKPAAAANGEHHACHESSSTGATALPVPHSCGHDSDGTIAPQELIRLLVAIGIVDVPVNVGEPSGLVVIGVRSPRVGPSPPPLLEATTPLRV